MLRGLGRRQGQEAGVGGLGWGGRGKGGGVVGERLTLSS